MSTVKFSGSPCKVAGTFPKAGDVAPDFKLTGADLKDIRKADFEGKKVILNIFPSLDTDVCAASVRRFNKEASSLDNTVVLCVSGDLPFAATRFCTIEGLDNVKSASAFRSPEFGKDYGVMLEDGPLAGLLARAVVVLDEKGNVVYSQLVDEITNEPDYVSAIAAVK